MPYTIAEFRSLCNDAEQLMQEVQSFRNEAGVPAINEMRNAGHHFIKAIDDTGALVSQSDLDAAANHARRASYEATEAGIMTAVAMVKAFQADYRTIVLSDLVPDYISSCTLTDKALRTVERARAEGEDRAVDHSDRIAVFRKIRPFAEQLVTARLEANKRLDDKQREARRFIWGVSLTALGVVVALAAIIISIIIYRLSVPPLANQAVKAVQGVTRAEPPLPRAMAAPSK